MSNITTKAPTLKEVAKLAGVSLSTVSCVLNNDSKKVVSDHLRQRVLDAAKTLNYQPNFIARSMRGKERRFLAIVVPQFENVFFTKLINGAEKISYENGYMLIFCSTYDDPAREEKFIKNLLAQRVDGFLIAPTIKGWDNIQMFREQKIPFVVLDRYLDNIADPFDLVAFDNEIGSYHATKHLLEKGHRELAYLDWDSPFPHIQLRKRGFIRALQEAGIPEANRHIISGRANPDEGYKMANALFSLHNPTAILAAQHLLAEGLVSYLRATGRAIPDDVSVIIHGQPSWARLNVPNFTCIGHPAYEIGEIGARLLLDRIANPQLDYKKIILKPSIVYRDSVKNRI